MNIVKISVLVLVILSFLQTFLGAMEEERMERQGTSLTVKTTDPLGRPASTVISEELFNKLNRPFAAIDSLIPPAPSLDESDFAEFMRTVEAEKEPGRLRQIFSIREKEAVIIEGRLEDSPAFTYFVTGGIHNCVAIALWGCNAETGDFFTGLAHVRRKNRTTSIKPLLDTLLKYPTKRITLHSGYKSETLLNIFQYITSNGLEVTSVYVNNAYHAVQNDAVKVTYHPHYFGKTRTSEIEDNVSYFSLFPPVHGQNQRASNVIIEVKTGRLVEIPARYHVDLLMSKGKNFVSLSDSLRIPGLQTKEDFKIYEPSPSLEALDLVESDTVTSKKTSKRKSKKK
ncbi:MAG: hypothetical protein K2Q34_00545 [Alphaproteobacteria bacterium]|nr:hypothetical protein [Alphaproteobacteria bacterium]